MTSSSPPLPVNTTGQLAESIPGFNPAPLIAAGEHRLADYLGMPTRQLLDQFGVQRGHDAHASPANHEANQEADHDPSQKPHDPINPVDPSQLISPVINALSTLGAGQFPGMDPTTAFNGISNAVDTSAIPVRQALDAVQQGWLGASSMAATTKTGAALANGAEVSTQAAGLQNSLSVAVSEVAQARTQLIAIVNEFFATVAAIGPSIIFPWGWAAVLAAAAKAVTHTTQVITEAQSSLAAQGSAVSAIGAPVSVTAAPQLGTAAMSAMSPMGSTGTMSMLSPLMLAAQAGAAPAMMAASAAGAAAKPSTTDATTRTPAGNPNAEVARAASAHKTANPAAFASPVRGGGGGAPTGASVPRFAAPAAAPAAAAEAATSAMPAASPRPVTGGMPMTGAGMMGAPLAGAGHTAGAGGAHTAASFLHTSDQGGKVVGDRSTVAPPVIGEADPNDTPDIELRI